MRSVEMQIAIPRTQDVGKIPSELQQRSTQEQTFMTSQQIKEIRQMSQRSTNVDETANTSIREEGKNQQSSQENSESHSSQQEQQSVYHSAVHPYKGHRIDLSL
ncbi:hypothetical protein PNBC_04765 [Paenibacillus crassostreae]|uniref:RNA polymerase subunit sigma n=2 Tax=Paenibacillus crassostreae TaxID=1763538 RepID=A0A167FMM8_9BACL|nr:hypothetical protein PNBC_04765 [Paenibacillus crassostreae]